ncbi:MAG TPA: DUF3179 domain-containing (seleno)protein [Thermoanaerobaculia bacterium]|nr:DUF3179 domain-containing (seleno)protein [Thermoanaerobaculia bacterium]
MRTALSLLLATALAGCALHPPGAVTLPPLNHSPLLRAKAATYLSPDDPVLGLQIGSDLRAYPLRILDRHAVANEAVNGVPVAVAWCRSCGSAVAYRRDTSKGTLTFAASGTLREGDQLLRDKETGTLWKQLTGEPVEGRLARSGIKLQPVPVVLTTWGNWTRVHPETRVLSLETGAGKDDPQAGQAEAAESSFLYGLLVNGTPKAYPIETLVKAGVVDDEIAGRPVVVVWEPGADAQNRTVRAYERGDRIFTRTERAFLGATFLTDQDGQPWLIGEEALTTPDGKRLTRIPGYLTRSAGWSAAYPRSAVWEGK